jgi:hypothetical protein
MEMQFSWVRDKVAHEMYELTWHPLKILKIIRANITWILTILQLDHTTCIKKIHRESYLVHTYLAL